MQTLTLMRELSKLGVGIRFGLCTHLPNWALSIGLILP
jgi:hypothetical protein